MHSVRQVWALRCHLPYCNGQKLFLGKLINHNILQDMSWTAWLSSSYATASCLRYLPVSILHLLFILFFVTATIWNRVDLQKASSKSNRLYYYVYRMTLVSCVILTTVYSVVLIWGMIYGFMKGWSKSALEEAAEIVQAVAWLTMSVAVIKAKREGREKFPVFLRTWWIFSFLFSVFTVFLNILLLKRKLRLPIHGWVDMAALPICMFLCIVAISGRIGLRSDLEDLQEPLLNGLKDKVPPYATAGILRLATFSWLDSLISVGYKKPIEIDDIPELVEDDQARTVYGILKTNWEQMTAESLSGTVSVSKCLIKSFWKGAAINACFAGIYTIAYYVGPYLIDDFVEYLGGRRRFANEGYILAGVFFAAKIVESFTQRHWFFGIQRWGLHIRAALTALIYQKGLYLSSLSRQRHTTGEIINYMSVDVQRIGDFSWYLHDTWLLPIQVSLALFILYKRMGVAAFAALGAAALAMLANLPLAMVQEKFQEKIMEAKDARMKTTSEVLRSMRILKLQAWEIRFLKKLEGLRKVEYGWLFKFLYAQSAVTSLFWGAPIFVAIVTFGTCVLMGIPLTAGRVLSALATIRVLQEPINNLPDLVSMFAQTKVSLDRIGILLQKQELQRDAIDYVPDIIGDSVIEIERASFSWDASVENLTLIDLDLRVNRGMRVAVCGVVGSGKSSLLSCILGEIPRLSGTVRVCGSRAYVPQTAWIQSGRIEDSILFGRAMEKTRYENVLKVCALGRDLELFSHGDQTEIGERGINLSGGQKQRIQLARAIYQDADVYLLDDPFSAVDAQTGAHLFKECILEFLASKTIIYVTHQVEFLPAADLIVVMRDGRIAQIGKYGELLQAGTDFVTLVGAHTKALESIIHSSGHSMQDSKRLGTAHTTEELQQEGLTMQLNGGDFQKLKRANSKTEETTGKEILAQIIQDEERETGKVSMTVYWSFITAAHKGALIPVILLAQIMFQLLQIGSNYWMAWATPETSDEQPVVSSSHLILIYIALATGSALCVVIRAFLVSTVSLITSQKFFSSMLHCIFRAPMSFFDTTPAGRILNRASIDQSALDLEIPARLAGLAFSSIQILGIIAVMCQAAWEVFALFVPVAALCIWLQRYYIASARELARLVGIHKSPIIHHFGESISGAAVIRAFSQDARFMEKNLKLFDRYSRPSFNSIAAMEWLCIRLDLLTNLVFAFSLLLVVSLPTGTIDPGIAGLSITYGLTLNTIQAWVIWNLCNVENKIISLERIQQYTCLPSEAPLAIEKSHPPGNWPAEGTIEIENLQIRYGAHMPLVLHGITCTFSGGKKVGVVGRTGSGKSTLIQALFRIIEPASGKIMIDGVDISSIGLHDLRSRLSIIPQDPTIFQGTVRDNLDPLGEHTDAEIWEALEKSELGPVMRAKDQKLDALVAENGENWSVGQRQLVCLGRALLKNTRILVLDEATASVDTATDGVVQGTIRSEFADCTVITIAHRIPTIIDSDQVLILSDGKIAEYDLPARLLRDWSSLFSQLVSEYSTR